MTRRESVIEQINHRECHPVPYTLYIYDSVSEALDDYYGDTAWRKTLTSYLDVLTIVGYHPAPEEVDGSHFRDAYGGVWRTDRNVNHQTDAPIKEPSPTSIALPLPEDLVTATVLDSVIEQSGKSGDRFRLGMIGAGPWEFFWHLRGFQDALMDVAAEPAFAEELFERITEQLIAYIDLAAGLPLDGLFLGDDWGGQDGVLLGPDIWRRYIKPSWKRVIDAAHRHNLPVFNHCCGSVAAIMPDVVEIGLDCLESVQPEAAGNDPYIFKREYGRDITFWGGLGSQTIIPFGTPDELRAEIARLVREMGEGGGYILAPAKGLMPDTPVENAAAIVESFIDQPIQ